MRFLRFLRFLRTAPVAALTATRCATLQTNGSTQRVEVSSTPPAAEVFLDGQAVGVTPVEVVVSRRDPIPAIRIEKDGFRPSEQKLRRSTSWWLLADVGVGVLISIFALAHRQADGVDPHFGHTAGVAAGAVPVVLDYLTGAAFRFQPRRGRCHLGAGPGAANDGSRWPDSITALYCCSRSAGFDWRTRSKIQLPFNARMPCTSRPRHTGALRSTPTRRPSSIPRGVLPPAAASEATPGRSEGAPRSPGHLQAAPAPRARRATSRSRTTSTKLAPATDSGGRCAACSCTTRSRSRSRSRRGDDPATCGKMPAIHNGDQLPETPTLSGLRPERRQRCEPFPPAFAHSQVEVVHHDEAGLHARAGSCGSS